MLTYILTQSEFTLLLIRKNSCLRINYLVRGIIELNE